MTSTKRVLPALTDIASLGGGVLLTSRALDAGWSRERLRDALNAGRWVRLHRGAWAPPGSTIGPALRVRALQVQYPCLVASHRLAAALHGIETLTSAVEFICLCGGEHRHRHEGVTVHRPARAPEGTVVQRGVHATTVLRTLVDLACTRPLDEAVVSLDSALHRGWAQREQLARALAALPRRHGLAAAREALGLADPRSESAAESRARVVMWQAGLRPRTQVRFRGPWGEYRVDLVVEQGDGLPALGVEIEGFTYHASRADHQRDVHRFNQLGGVRGLGRVLRFTRDDVFRRPARMIRRIEVALAELRAMGPVS